MIVLLLLVTLIAVPVAEIAVLIEVGSVIGTVPTIALIVLTAVVGSILIRHQGLGVIAEMRRGVENDRPTLAPVIEGLFLLIAGLMLLTPGFITDAFGFALLIPPLRGSVARAAWLWISRRGHVIRTSGDGRWQDDEIEGRYVDLGTRQDTEQDTGRRKPQIPDGGSPDPNSPWSKDSPQ